VNISLRFNTESNRYLSGHWLFPISLGKQCRWWQGETLVTDRRIADTKYSIRGGFDGLNQICFAVGLDLRTKFINDDFVRENFSSDTYARGVLAL